MYQSILAVDSLAIQRSLTILEDRYRELREIGEKRFESWEKEKLEARQMVAEMKQQVEEAELTMLQLQQVQEELDRYFLQSRRQAEVLVSMEALVARAAKLVLNLSK